MSPAARTASIAAATATLLPLLVIYDDSLHNRWELLGGDSVVNLDAPSDAGRLRGGETVPCGRSISATFNGSRQVFTLQSDEPVVLTESLPLVLSFAFDATRFKTAPEKCSTSAAVKGSCLADFCVSVRLNSTRRADTLFLPLCVAEHRRAARGGRSSDGWSQMEAPLDAFGIRDSGALNQLLFVRGDRIKHRRQLRLDEIWLSSRGTPLAGDVPPSYGRSDINVVRRNWLQASNNRPHTHTCRGRVG